MLRLISLIALVYAGISQECMVKVSTLTKMQKIKSIDAWGKPVGVLKGSFTSFGDRRECLELDGFTAVTVEGTLFIGQQPLTSVLGICLPLECTGDVQAIMDRLVTIVNDQTEPADYFGALKVFSSLAAPDMKLRFVVKSSNPHRMFDWTAGTYVMVSIWSVLVLVVILATAVDYYHKISKAAKVYHEETTFPFEVESLLPNDSTATLPLATGSTEVKKLKPSQSILGVFSLYKTLPSLLNIQPPKNYQELGVLNMLRVVSILWVILGHTVSIFSENLPVDLKDLVDEVRNHTLMVAMNAFVSVDTFFYLSSFLVAYMFFADSRSLQKFNYFKYLLLRYVRLVPAMAMVLFSWWFIYPVINAGTSFSSPLWYRKVKLIQNQCPKYWWAHLTMTSNIYPTYLREQCVGPFWYISADMQLYAVAPLFILPLMKTRYAGWIWMAVVGLVAHFLWTYLPSRQEHIYALPTPAGDFEAFQNNVNQWHKVFYQNSYNHLVVTLVGIAAAFYCVQVRKLWSDQTLKQQVGSFRQWMLKTTLMQLVGGFLLLLITFLPCDYAKNLTLWESRDSNALYNYFSRLGWAVGLSLIIIPIITAPKLVQSSLDEYNLVALLAKSKVWQVLARLTFSVYLIHCIIINLWVASNEREQSYSWPLITTGYGGCVFWSYVLATLLYLVVEAPFGSLVRLMF